MGVAMRWLWLVAALGGLTLTTGCGDDEEPIAAQPTALPSVQEARTQRTAATRIKTAPPVPQTPYPHETVMMSGYGRGGEQFWIFEPADPHPPAAPVVVFLHGWSELNPRSYGAWIEHLVRQGHIVIYPRYQVSVASRPDTFTPNAIAAVRRAMTVLQEQERHAKPDLSRLAIVGHSMGGLIAVNLAATAADHDLPAFAAVMAVQPGISSLKTLADLSRIPPATRLVTMAGDMDTITGSADALRIVREPTNVPDEHKTFIMLRSDHRGRPPLIADHIAPMGTDDNYNAANITPADDGQPMGLSLVDLRANPFPVTMWDYHAFWRPLDELLTAAFHAEATHINLTLGQWSDGTPVHPMHTIEIDAGE